MLLDTRPMPATEGGFTEMISNTDAEASHLDLLREIAHDPDPVIRARRATEEIMRLDAERGDFTAIRDVAIHNLARNGYSYAMIGNAINLTRDRAAQLVRRANEVHGSAVQRVSKIKRRAGKPA